LDWNYYLNLLKFKINRIRITLSLSLILWLVLSLCWIIILFVVVLFIIILTLMNFKFFAILSLQWRSALLIRTSAFTRNIRFSGHIELFISAVIRWHSISAFGLTSGSILSRDARLIQLLLLKLLLQSWIHLSLFFHFLNYLLLLESL